MKRLKYIFSAVVVAICLSGCFSHDEMDYDTPTPDLGGSALSFQIPTMDVVTQSRAEGGVGEYTINNGALFFFDIATNKCHGYVVLTDANIVWSDSNIFDVTLGGYISYSESDVYDETDRVVGVFNYDTTSTPALPTADAILDITVVKINEYYPLSESYLASVTKELNVEKYDLGMPMSVNDFIASESSYHEVYRALACLEIFVTSNVDTSVSNTSHSHTFDDKNVAYAVVNEVTSGSMIYLGEEPTTDDGTLFKVTDADGATTSDGGGIKDSYFSHGLTLVSSSDELTSVAANRVYLYPYGYSTKFIDGSTVEEDEYSSARFALLLKHEDDNHEDHAHTQYYKLNLVDKAAGNKYYNIERNHKYRVVITQVHSNGYDTLQEAYDMPPSNIDYLIYDNQGEATLSNGQYAISMDEVVNYSQIDIYGDKEVKVEFNNISYYIPTEMKNVDLDKLTNEVIVTYNNGVSSDDTIEVSVSNPFDTAQIADSEYTYAYKGALSSTPQDLVFTIKGEGTCTIGLMIKLGNLDTGAGEITINKLGDCGFGALDAHPVQLQYSDREYVAGSWVSDSSASDFGARVKCDNDEDDTKMVIYMGHNATPVGYKTINGAYTSNYAVDSYPVFEPKDRSAYYTYKKEDGSQITTKVMVTQLDPFYLGHFGGHSLVNSDIHYYRALISERIEEIPYIDSNLISHENGGVMQWSSVAAQYYKEPIVVDGMYQNLVEGRAINLNIVENDTNLEALASRYCYMKNDINGDGVIGDDEPIEWCLPAQNQMLAMWISKYQYDSDTDYGFNIAESPSVYYWSSSEVESYDGSSNFTEYVNRLNMQTGEINKTQKVVTSNTDQCHVRCVRGVVNH